MKRFFVLILALISTSIYAQKDKDEESGVIRNYGIKFSPTQIVVGEFNFTYEQRVAKKISLELEVGPTMSQFGLGFGNQKIWQGNSGLGLFNFHSISADASSGIGVLAGIAPRIYPTASNYSMKGFYISPLFKYRLFNYSVKDNLGILGNEKASISQLFFRFNMGIQFWPKDANFIIDMYFGVGMSTYNIRGNEIDFSGNYDVNGNPIQIWHSYSDNGVRFNAVTGVRFGFGN